MMKSLFLSVFVLCTIISFGQIAQGPDSIQLPVYDTTSISIQSRNSFFFLSKLYSIPRDCESKNESNCCSFNGQVTKSQKDIFSSQIGCNDGTTLFWANFDTEEAAKSAFESYPPQIKKQMKNFKQTKILLSVCGIEVPAYRIDYTTLQGYDFAQITFYLTSMGQNISGHLSINKKVKKSSELTAFFQQLVKF